MTTGIPFREDRVVLLEADTWPDEDDPVTFRTVVRWVGHAGLHVELEDAASESEAAVALAPGSALFGLYVDGEGVYSFATAILGHHPDRPRTLVLQAPQEISQLEPRRYPRIVAEVEVEGTVLGKDEPSAVFASTHDLSVSGLRFATTHLLEPGDELLLTLRFGEDDVVSVEGTVVQTRLGRGDGTRWVHVGFSDLSPRARERLDQFTTSALGMRHRGSSLPRTPVDAPAD